MTASDTTDVLNDATLARRILEGQRLILEMLDSSPSLEATLSDLCGTVERLVGGVKCAVMLHDPSSHQLHVGAAPGLPEPFVKAINGVEVDSRGASCGAAVHHGKTVVVEEIEGNPIWTRLADDALANGLYAAWSIPLRQPRRNNRGEPRIVGTLDFYFEQVERYSEPLLRTCEAASDLASFVLHNAHVRAVSSDRATVDGLTTLPNRRSFQNELRRLVEEQKAQDAGNRRRFAVAALDLDQFKDVNDTLGYKMGDLLLQALGQRLSGSLRDNDLVARSGGDDFILLIRDLQRDEDINIVAEKVLRRANDPYDFGGHGLFVTASMGISVYPWDGEDGSTLLRNAETALRSAKERGGSNYQFFRPTMARNKPTFDLWMEQAKLGSQLRDALKNNELELHYQLKYQKDGYKVCGAEALMRWRHPELGLLAPQRFIPMAEHMGLIVKMGEWCLHEACRQNKQWQDTGLTRMPVSVNVSPSQFRQGRLLDDIRSALKETSLAAEFLELEIVEQLAMEDTATNLQRLQSLANLGVQLSIDDFGTGFSSLSYLSKFPLDNIKIDRSFIKDIGTKNEQDEDSQSIVLTIISMARNLSLQVVAEGVETEAQVEFLFDNDCDMIQGFYFSRPMPPDEITELLISRS